MGGPGVQTGGLVTPRVQVAAPQSGHTHAPRGTTNTHTLSAVQPMGFQKEEGARFQFHISFYYSQVCTLWPPTARPEPRHPPGAWRVGWALPRARVAGLLGEGSRLYSYLPRGQHHCPETTQPTTSPRRRPGAGGSVARRCPTPSPALPGGPQPPELSWRAGQAQGRSENADGASVSPRSAAHTVHLQAAGGQGGPEPEGPRALAGLGQRPSRFLLGRAEPQGGMAPAPTLPRPDAELDRLEHRLGDALMKADPWVSLPCNLSQAHSNSSWCPALATGTQLRAQSRHVLGATHRIGEQAAQTVPCIYWVSAQWVEK